jgi:hypothetical protein
MATFMKKNEFELMITLNKCESLLKQHQFQNKRINTCETFTRATDKFNINYKKQLYLKIRIGGYTAAMIK